MAAGLKNLIRLHEWTVDERRRELGQHIRKLNELDQLVRDLETELKREQALAGSSEMGITFGAYYNLFRYRVKPRAFDQIECRCARRAALFHCG